MSAPDARLRQAAKQVALARENLDADGPIAEQALADIQAELREMERRLCEDAVESPHAAQSTSD